MSASATTCPLCLKAAAVFGTTNFGRNKAYDCKKCGQFAVSDQAETRIRGLPVEFKDDWQAKIRATTPDELFVIIVGPVGSGGQLEEERVPRHTIQPPP